MSKEILDHYVSRFETKGLEPDRGPRAVGMEAKFCLTDSDGRAVTAGLTEEMFAHLSDIGWKVDTDVNLGIATGASRESATCPAVVSTGTGHCKIEFSVPYAESVDALEANFLEMVKDVKSYTDANDASLLCLGVHPATNPSPDMVQKKTRHVFWDEVFKSGLVHLFAICSDCQVHVDIDAEEVHTAVNVLQGFAGPQIALTANATVWKGDVDPGYLDVREAFWDWWLEGEDRAGVTRRPFTSLADYVDRVSSLAPVFIMREGQSLGIYRYPRFRDYYDASDGAFALTAGGQEVTVSPQVEDIDLHDTFNWYACRFSHYGTVENRANCQQPPEAILSLPALTLGLVENLERSWDYLAGFDWELLRNMRVAALRDGPMASLGDVRALDMSRKMLSLAREGLLVRGKGEQRYLDPLWERLEKRSCPAMECREIYIGGGMGSLVQRYSL